MKSYLRLFCLFIIALCSANNLFSWQQVYEEEPNSIEIINNEDDIKEELRAKALLSNLSNLTPPFGNFPKDSILISNSSSTLQWFKTDYKTNTSLEFYTVDDSLLYKGIILSYNSTTSSYPTNLLPPDRFVKWRIKSVDTIGGESDWTNWLVFKTPKYLIDKPVTTYPKNNQVIGVSKNYEPNSPMLVRFNHNCAWLHSTTFSFTDLQTNETKKLIRFGQDKEYDFSSDLTKHTFYKVTIQYSSVYGDYSEISEPINFRTFSEYPNITNIKVLNSLDNKFVNDSIAKIAISSKLEHSASSYTYSYSYNFRESGNKATVYDISLGTDSTFNVKVESGKQYILSVYKSNERGSSTATIVFSTLPFSSAINAPKLISPLDNSSVSSQQLFLTWNKVPGATSYYLYNSFELSNIDEKFIEVNDTVASLKNGLNFGDMTIYWKVVPKKGDTLGNHSPIWKFNLFPTSIDKEDNQVLLLQNPVTDKLVINEEYKYYRIFDISGLLLKEGQSVSEIDVTSIPSGIYILNIDDKVTKFVISR
jgi:hypothetical protein